METIQKEIIKYILNNTKFNIHIKFYVLFNSLCWEKKQILNTEEYTKWLSIANHIVSNIQDQFIIKKGQSPYSMMIENKMFHAHATEFEKYPVTSSDLIQPIRFGEQNPQNVLR